MRREQGFSLIEILIALFVLGLGLVGILTLYPVGMASTRDILAHSRAAMLASTARATLVTLDGSNAIRDWQRLNAGDSQEKGPWFYPHDDEVFVPYEPPSGNPPLPYSFIPGDANDVIERDRPEVREIIESPDAPLFSFNVVLRQSDPLAAVPTPTEKKLNLYVVGSAQADGWVDNISPLPLPPLDPSVAVTANGHVIDDWVTSSNTFHTTAAMAPTGLQDIHVTGNLHVRATFTEDKTYVDVDTANDWAWPLELKVNDYLQGPDGNWYRVEWIHPTNRTANLLISREYEGPTITDIALIGSLSAESLVAQTAAFRSHKVDYEGPASHDKLTGQLEEDLATGECWLEVEKATDPLDPKTAEDLAQLKIRPGDHVALLTDDADPATYPADVCKHGFWYEIAEIRPNATTPNITDVVLKQPKSKIAEVTSAPYDFVVTRSIVGLFETSLGPK